MAFPYTCELSTCIMEQACKIDLLVSQQSETYHCCFTCKRVSKIEHQPIVCCMKGCDCICLLSDANKGSIRCQPGQHQLPELVEASANTVLTAATLSAACLKASLNLLRFGLSCTEDHRMHKFMMCSKPSKKAVQCQRLSNWSVCMGCAAYKLLKSCYVSHVRQDSHIFHVSLLYRSPRGLGLQNCSSMGM